MMIAPARSPKVSRRGVESHPVSCTAVRCYAGDAARRSVPPLVVAPHRRPPAPGPDPTASHAIEARRCRAAAAAVIAQLAAVAFADPADLFDSSGRLLPVEEIPPAICAIVKTFEVRVVRGRRVILLELHPKMPALTTLARHLGMFDRRPVRVGCSDRSGVPHPAEREGC